MALNENKTMGLPYSRILIDSVASVSYSSAVTPFGWPSGAPMRIVSTLCLPRAHRRFDGAHLGAGDLQTMTQELIAELREWINYDPDTGVLTWKKPRRKIRVGAECGGYNYYGYRYFRFNRVFLFSHRVAFALAHSRWPTNQIDHINRVRDDNRIGNLRESTQAENTLNSSRRSDNTSGVVGVSWNKNRNKWQAHVWCRGVSANRYFTDLGEAAEWVKKKRAELHGEFAAQH